MNQVQLFEENFQDLIKNGVHFLQMSTTDNDPKKDVETWVPSSTSKLMCSYCKTEFDDTIQQREHYKLDWHRYNLKKNLIAKAPLTEEEFNDRADDLSSISGSDSEKEDSLENIAMSQGKIFLKNDRGNVFSLYRCLLFEKKDDLDDGVLLKGLQQLHQNNQWTVLMLGGGHFAGAVFQGINPILHKTFHSYTVRAGQGGSQTSKDNRSGSSQPKSAGASLRRYNEATLMQHVHDIVESWRSEINKSNLIVYRATGPFNRSVFFGGKIPILNRSDSRLKSIPFSTRRATFTELKRVHTLLTTVTVYDTCEMVSNILKQEVHESPTKRNKVKSTHINRAKSREGIKRPSPVKDLLINLNELDADSSENNEDDLVELITCNQEISMSNVLQEFEDTLTPEERKQRRKKPKKFKSKAKRQAEKEEIRKKQLYTYISLGNINELKLYLDKIEKSKDDTVESELIGAYSINEVLDGHGNTFLHIAAAHQQFDMIKLLLEKDADPCIRNDKYQTPYACTQDKDVRTVFKTFAEEFPDRHNYTKAQIPIPVQLTEEQLEKRRIQRKLKKEKDKEKKKQIELKEQEQSEQQRFLNLSDREKRALAAERRILNQNGAVVSRCFLCGTDISGKVPFEYSGNRFCSIDCLKAHRLSHTNILSV